MFTKLILRLARTYFGGRKSWLVLSLLGFVLRRGKSFLGRQESVDLSKVKPGQKLVIEHLPMTHKAEIKLGKSPKGGKKRTDFAAWKSRQRES